MEIIKHNDPFLGEIELKKVSEKIRHAVGHSKVISIFIDSHENFYIFEALDLEESVLEAYIPKDIVQLIIDYKATK